MRVIFENEWITQYEKALFNNKIWIVDLSMMNYHMQEYYRMKLMDPSKMCGHGR